MSFRTRRKPSRRAVTAASAAAPALDAPEPRRLLAFEVGMGGAWSPAAIDEGGGVATFHVDRYDYDAGDYSQPLTVNLAVRGWDQGGASPASADDLAFPATVTFAPGEWQTSFDVTAVDDLLPEPDEPYEMYVLPGSGYTTDPAWSRQSAVFASDTPNVWVEAAPPTATATEGGQAAQVTFRRDNASGPLTARFGLTGDVADVAAPGVPDSDWLYPVSFADGQAAVTVPLSAVDDAELESPEQVMVYLVSNAYGTAGVDKYFAPGDQARPFNVHVAIADDDKPIVSVAATDADASEDGRAPATFTISRDRADGGDLDVYFQLGGSATHGVEGGGGVTPTDADYTGGELDSESTTVFRARIPSGELSTTVAFTPLNDALVEGAETITLTLLADQTPGGPFYFQAGGGGGAAANGGIKDLVAKKIYDPAAPAETQLAVWVDELNNDDYQTRAGAHASLTAALADYPEVVDHLAWLYQQIEPSDDNLDQRMQLEAMLGPVRLQMEDNRLVITPLGSPMPTGVASMVAISGDIPDTGYVTVGTNSSLTMKPLVAEARRRITVTIKGLNANNEEVFSYDRTFAITIVEQ